MSAPLAGRIRAFDWLRGVSVVVMIQRHAMDLLQPALRHGVLYDWLDRLDGLVAPAFTLTAGFSLALVQVRGAAGGNQAQRIRKTVRRLAEVLFVATLVNWMWFPIFREPRWILRIDILHCIGLSLLLALPLTAGLARRPQRLRVAALLLAAAAFGLAPLAEGVRGPLANFVNVASGSVFPLLPWAGYVYLGVSLGAVAAEGDPRALSRALLAIAALGGATYAAAPIWRAIYPPHAFWITDPSRHGDRFAIVALLILGLLFVERRAQGAWQTGWAMRALNLLATSSLSAYFFHQLLLYYSVFGFSFVGRFGNRCGWTAYALLTGLLLVETFALTFLMDRLYRIYDRRLAA